MVRCGVVWCGVVWCDVVWCGVVWCGVVWCGVVWCIVVWCIVVWCGVKLFLTYFSDCLEKLQFSSNCLSVTEVEVGGAVGVV